MINDIVKIVYAPDNPLPIPEEYKINIWIVVLFPADGDKAAIIRNLVSGCETFIPLAELKYWTLNIHSSGGHYELRWCKYRY